MKKDDIISKIKEQAYENVNRKIEEEKKATEAKINEELDIVEEILIYIKNKLIFKTIGDRWKCNYVLVTEEVFFEDYNKVPEYSWQKGIEINHDKERTYEPFIKINGEKYYDIRYITANYEEAFNRYKNRLQNLNESFGEIEEAAKKLKAEEPAIKKLIEQYKLLDLEKNE